MPPRTQIAVDTNVLIDLAANDDALLDAFDLIESRVPNIFFKVPPTVIAELAYIAESDETAPASLAQKALSELRSHWNFTPADLAPVAHGIAAKIASKLLQENLLPSTEKNDAYILAEAALDGAMILLTSDLHLLKIPMAPLTRILKECDVASPLILSSPKEFSADSHRADR